MPELGAPDYVVARFLIERGLAALYLVAFVVSLPSRELREAGAWWVRRPAGELVAPIRLRGDAA